jgi:transcriptional repressor NrdR
MVVKKDGRREAFDRQKVLRGLMTACEKRPVPAEALENIADEVERAAYGRGLREIHSRDIGEMVIEALKALDQVAYVRFASVYRNFQDIDQFKEIVETLSRSVREAQNNNRDSQNKKEVQEGRTDVA